MTKSDILKAEFLDELQERADNSFKGRPHEAFIDWYVEAEFGDLKWKFTDNVSDGGIDAVVWRPNDDPAVILVQSKFHEKVGKGIVGKNTYEELSDVIRIFRKGGALFDEWLSSVRADLRPVYRKAYEALKKSNSWFQQKKAFRLITTSAKAVKKLQSSYIPSESYLYSE